MPIRSLQQTACSSSNPLCSLFYAFEALLESAQQLFDFIALIWTAWIEAGTVGGVQDQWRCIGVDPRRPSLHNDTNVPELISPYLIVWHAWWWWWGSWVIFLQQLMALFHCTPHTIGSHAWYPCVVLRRAAHGRATQDRNSFSGKYQQFVFQAKILY